MPPLVSCLCVTEGRAAFHPWLWWNYAKQDHPNRELVVVAPEPPDLECRWVPCAPGLPVPVKRNLALDAATGPLVAWFDDDDWQHPRRLSTLSALGVPVAGSGRSWFLNLDTFTAEPFELARLGIFNSLLVAREVCGRFDEATARASDTPWMGALPRPDRVWQVMAMWLCHDLNLSNPAAARRFTHPLDDVVADVGEEAWAGTLDQLVALRHRLAIN